MIQSKSQPQWGKRRGGHISTAGDRDVIIIASFGEAAARIAGAVPRSSHELTEEDKKKMVAQGLSLEECTDDISILLARLRMDSRMEVIEMLISDNGSEMSSGLILRRLDSHFKESEKAGGMLNYHE